MKIFVSGLYSRMFSAFSIASNKIVSPHDVQFLLCIELFGGTVRMRMFANPTNVGHPIIFRVVIYNLIQSLRLLQMRIILQEQ